MKPGTELDLPWTVDGAIVIDNTGWYVAEIDDEYAGDCAAIAAYIVHAANAYPKLVEALSSLLIAVDILEIAERRERARQLLAELGE